MNERGNIKGELSRGEHKSLQTDRVILMPGPEEEVAWVGRMYRWLIEEDLSFREIADRLNEEGGTTDLNRPWTPGTIRTNEKYIGNRWPAVMFCITKRQCRSGDQTRADEGRAADEGDRAKPLG